jgi:hypothetical protein
VKGDAVGRCYKTFISARWSKNLHSAVTRFDDGDPAVRKAGSLAGGVEGAFRPSVLANGEFHFEQRRPERQRVILDICGQETTTLSDGERNRARLFELIERDEDVEEHALVIVPDHSVLGVIQHVDRRSL